MGYLNFKLIAFILAMLVYAIAFVVKKLQEQAAIKRSKDEQARRRLDALRTGRIEDLEVPAGQVVSASSGSPAPLSHQEATRRLQELAEHRRQQLEELRRRAAAQGRATPPPTSPVRPTPAVRPAPQQAPGRPQPQARPAPAAPRPTPRPAPRQTAPARQTRPQPSRPARPAPAQASPAPSRRGTPPKRRAVAQVDETERLSRVEADRAQGLGRQSTRSMPASAPVVPSVRLSPATFLIPTGKMGMAEWRRIIMLREILERPVALREPESGGE